jgi:hypothetical protein
MFGTVLPELLAHSLLALVSFVLDVWLVRIFTRGRGPRGA